MQETAWAVFGLVLLSSLSSLAMQCISLILPAWALDSAAIPSPVVQSHPLASKFSTTTLSNRSEAAALLDLRGDLGIRNEYWPRDSDPCSTWVGIFCEGGQVVEIQLSGLRRTVTFAMQPMFALDPIPKFALLRRLNASGFPLSGAIPDWFGGLTNLQVLDFTSAFISGSIPSTLADLWNLQTLILAHNNLTGDIPSSFRKLCNLTYLDVSFNGLTGQIPNILANLSNLTVVNLSHNNFIGEIPVVVGELLRLQGLYLSNNYLEGSIPSQLGDLSLLSKLDLGLNALSGPIPPDLGRLTGLTTLVLSNNSLNGSMPEQILNCMELQELIIDHNSIGGTLPPLLGSLTNLSTLNLSNNNLTGVMSVGNSSLSEAKLIDLSHNSFFGPLPLKLTNLSKLVAVDVSHNYFNGNLPLWLSAGALLEKNCLSGVGNQRAFESCEMFYNERGLAFHGILVAAPSTLPMNFKNIPWKGEHLVAILGGIFGGLVVVIVVIVLVSFVLKHERSLELCKTETVSAPQKRNVHHFSGHISVNLFCLGEQFSYSQLRQATREFNSLNLLKIGHTGEFYQGLLEGGVQIIVKRIVVSRFEKDAILAELDFFAKASHTRLVPLLGHCLEQEDEKLLVYKYMPNRDLAYALHRKARTSLPEDALQSLDWITRLKIAIGAAEGLTYLHHECTPPLVHRDVQASSILLDDKFEVRLGSLTQTCVAEEESHHGVLARIFRISQTSEQGEPGALASTCAYDVYCFGKVLLELVSGKLGISGFTDSASEAWLEAALPLINIHDKESISKLVDPSLIVDEDLLEEVWAMAIVAKSCLNPKSSKRPLMRYILKALENPLKVVREDNFNASGRSRTSSHSSWNAAFFGSWWHSSSETVAIPASLKEEHLYRIMSKQLGNEVSEGSLQGDVSHRRPGSNEIFPEPMEDLAIQMPSIEQDTLSYSVK